MFDWIRNLTKSAAEKQQELLTAYVDGELTPAERQRFEQMMAGDEMLRAEMERQRLFKRAIQELPRVAAPRNFILNPADYRAPAPQRAVQLYPALRAATALAALFLVVIVGTSLFSSGVQLETASDIALVPTDTANLAAGAAESVPVEASAEALAAEPPTADDGAADTAADAAAEAEAEPVEEMAEEAEAEFFLAETATPAATPDMTGAAEAADQESATAEEAGMAGAEEAAAPRPSTTDTPEPRVQQVEPAVIEGTETERVATELVTATETPAGPITISPTSTTAPPDIPWLPISAISLFVILLAATLLVRWHKNRL